MRNSVVKTYVFTENNTFLEVIGTTDGVIFDEYKSKWKLVKSYLNLVWFIITHRHKKAKDKEEVVKISLGTLSNYYDESKFETIKSDMANAFTNKKLNLPNYIG